MRLCPNMSQTFSTSYLSDIFDKNQLPKYLYDITEIYTKMNHYNCKIKHYAKNWWANESS